MLINHCGINFTHHNFKIHRPNGSNDYLFVYTKTPTIFTLEGRDILTPPNTVFLYRKGSLQHFRGAEEIYINDYIHFNTQNDEDEAFMQELGLIYDTPLQLFDTNRFMTVHQQLVYETQSCADNTKLAIDSLLRYFLIKLAESMQLVERCEKRVFDQLYALRKRIYQDPGLPWEVATMAERLGFSPSHFHRLYKQTFRISCMADVICARTELAKHLLIFTDGTAREISARCGYQNETHFSRQFKKATGKSPQEYRKGYL